MPRPVTGSVYREARGTYGIRWVQDGRRPQKGGFATKTAAREWFSDQIKPRLKRGAPSADVTFDEFCRAYLDRWSPGSPKTEQTLKEWLAPARERFGRFSLVELEGAAQDIAAWRKGLPSEYARYSRTRALRQVFAAAVRWQYMARNPAVDAGANPQPRGDEVRPFSRVEIDRVCEEMAACDAALVVFAAETGLRTNEWMAVERRDVDRANPAVAVSRRFAAGRSTPYPKTARRRVPLTPRAVEALGWLPVRLESALLFPAPGGGHVDLSNWRLRAWYPALDAAGVEKRGPYSLRHSFATNALAAGVSIFQLSRLMGASVATIERHYGHLVRESEDHLRGLLAAGGVEREEMG